MKYLLIFCMLLSGCKEEYDNIKEVKNKIQECKQIKENIDEIENLYYEMRRELKINTQYTKNSSGTYFKMPAAAKYFELIGSPYVENLQKQFKEKDCNTYL
jgi:hypothetical protein